MIYVLCCAEQCLLLLFDFCSFSSKFVFVVGWAVINQIDEAAAPNRRRKEGDAVKVLFLANTLSN